MSNRIEENPLKGAEQTVTEEAFVKFMERVGMVPGAFGKPTLAELYKKDKRPLKEDPRDNAFLRAFYAARVFESGKAQGLYNPDLPSLSLSEFQGVFEMRDPEAFERLADDIRIIRDATAVNSPKRRINPSDGTRLGFVGDLSSEGDTQRNWKDFNRG